MDLAGQMHGIKEVDEGIRLVSFMHHDLGYGYFEENLATPRQPVRHVRSVAHVFGPDTFSRWRSQQNKHRGLIQSLGLSQHPNHADWPAKAFSEIVSGGARP
jgi:hypothetical protein